ncbi:MAG: LytTR family DNA-binding domain-containing protein [Acidobacteriota bacterium]
MTVLRALIVDDEPLARALLHELLAEHDDIDVVGEARDGDEAVDLLRRHAVDVVFLDIRMPERDGFEVLRALSTLPHVVFVTAFDRYAVRAFEVAAVDYLLKPYDRERLDLALERVRERHRRAETIDTDRLHTLIDRLDRRSRYAERLFLKVGERTAVVPVRDVRWLEARRKLVRVHAGGRVFDVRDSLKRFEAEDLDPERFIRVSRSAIVHLEHVTEIQPWFHGEIVLLLDDGAQVTTTRAYRDRVAGLLGR